MVRYEVLAGAKLARNEKKRERERKKKKLAEIGSQTSFVMQTFTWRHEAEEWNGTHTCGERERELNVDLVGKM